MKLHSAQSSIINHLSLLIHFFFVFSASFGYLGAQVYRSVFKDYIPGIRPQCVHNQPTDIQTDFALRQIIQLVCFIWNLLTTQWWYSVWSNRVHFESTAVLICLQILYQNYNPEFVLCDCKPSTWLCCSKWLRSIWISYHHAECRPLVWLFSMRHTAPGDLSLHAGLYSFL